MDRIAAGGSPESSQMGGETHEGEQDTQVSPTHFDRTPMPITATRGIIAGLSWWGVGPPQMAKKLTQEHISANPLVLWDIRKRLHRAQMDSPVAGCISVLRTREFIRRQTKSDWTIVVSPHRFSPRVLKLLANRTEVMIAFLGDRPVASRELSSKQLDFFDKLIVADSSWLCDGISNSLPTAVEPWGSCLSDPELLNAGAYAPESLIVVGTPYPERVAFVNALARNHRIVVQGSAWEGKVTCKVLEAAPQVETIKRIRDQRQMVVNIQHGQFATGLNPQFFDYAAAAIPQFVVDAGRENLERVFELTPDTHVRVGGKISGDMEYVKSNAAQIADIVRGDYMFQHTVERVLR